MKRNYTKIAHTSKYDWLIRDEIDAVEEVLAKEPEKTLVEVESLLAKYPESPRLMLLKVKIFGETNIFLMVDFQMMVYYIRLLKAFSCSSFNALSATSVQIYVTSNKMERKKLH